MHSPSFLTFFLFTITYEIVARLALTLILILIHLDHMVNWSSPAAALSVPWNAIANSFMVIILGTSVIPFHLRFALSFVCGFCRWFVCETIFKMLNNFTHKRKLHRFNSHCIYTCACYIFFVKRTGILLVADIKKHTNLIFGIRQSHTKVSTTFRKWLSIATGMFKQTNKKQAKWFWNLLEREVS